jgi:hypothetical protein
VAAPAGKTAARPGSNDGKRTIISASLFAKIALQRTKLTSHFTKMALHIGG